MKKWIILKWIFEILTFIGLLFDILFFASLWFESWRFPTQCLYVYVIEVITLCGWLCCLRKITKFEAANLHMDLADSSNCEINNESKSA